MSLMVAHWTLRLISSLVPGEVRMFKAGLDGTVLLFTAALTIGTGILFGLFPALHSTRPNIISALRGQSGQPGGARAVARFRATLATGQIALSMALLIMAGLFMKSLFNVSRANPRSSAEQLASLAQSVPGNSQPRCCSSSLDTIRWYSSFR